MVVVCSVSAGATFQHVISKTTVDVIVAHSAAERVRAAVADQCVIVIGAGDVLDAGQRIVPRAAIGRAGRQIDVDCGRRGAVVRSVSASSAVKRVISAAADQGVIAGAARKHVGAIVASECVVVG